MSDDHVDTTQKIANRMATNLKWQKSLRKLDALMARSSWLTIGWRHQIRSMLLVSLAILLILGLRTGVRTVDNDTKSVTGSFSYGTNYSAEKEHFGASTQSALYERSNRTMPPVGTIASSPGRTNTIDYSRNWSGYAVNTAGNPHVTAVWAKWIVPTVSSASPKPAYSGDWIGIGGFYGDRTLIQTGTAEEIDSSGSTIYYAWYELIPASDVVVFSVSPGDLMAASIQYQGSNMSLVSIQDLTNGHSWNNGGNALTYTSNFYSAEWIHEATSFCTFGECIAQTLAKTSDVIFTDARAKVGSTIGSIGDFSTIQIMLDQNNLIIAEPGCLPSKDRFVETYTGDLDQVRAPPVLLDCSVQLSAQSGTPLTLNYYLFNDGASAYWFGANLRRTGTTNAMNDQPDDTSVSLPSGSGWYSRKFYLQTSVPSGTYDWNIALWSGTPGQSSMITTSGWSNGGLQVTAATYNVSFHVGYSIVGGGNPNSPTFNYVLSGATKSLTLSQVPTTVSADAGSTWSVTPNPLVGSSSSQRWYSNQPLTGTVPVSSTTLVFVFYRQTNLTLSYTVIGGGSGYSSPTFQANQFGRLLIVTLTATPKAYWFDYGATWTINPDPLSGSTSTERWFTTQATHGTIAANTTLLFNYNHQYYLSIQSSPLSYGTVSLASGWFNAGQTITIVAIPSSGHGFLRWTGSGTGSYTGTSSTATITMNSPITEVASFN